MAENSTGSKFFGPFDLVVVLVLYISVVSLALLAANVFDPWKSLGIAFPLSLALLLLLRVKHYRFRFRMDVSSLGMVALLLFSGLLRLVTYPWTGGGQYLACT